MQKLLVTKADTEIRTCVDDKQCFSVIAGAGSGKTTSLVMALKHLRVTEGVRLRRDDQKIVCITYTNRAADVISDRLDRDDLYLVSTLHKFLWGLVKRFTPNIREALCEHVIPAHIEKKMEDEPNDESPNESAAKHEENRNQGLQH